MLKLIFDVVKKLGIFYFIDYENVIEIFRFTR